jgi:hypothetical protein
LIDGWDGTPEFLGYVGRLLGVTVDQCVDVGATPRYVRRKGLRLKINEQTT